MSALVPGLYGKPLKLLRGKDGVVANVTNVAIVAGVMM